MHAVRTCPERITPPIRNCHVSATSWRKFLDQGNQSTRKAVRTVMCHPCTVALGRYKASALALTPDNSGDDIAISTSDPGTPLAKRKSDGKALAGLVSHWIELL